MAIPPFVFGRTQQAIQTPFEPNRNPQWGGNVGPSGISSTDVQSAIEEAKADALANDRFIDKMSYGGNANVGRWLESFSNIPMDEAPLHLHAATNAINIVARTTAVNATCTIGIYDIQVPATPVLLYTITFSGVKRVEFGGTPLFSTPAEADIAVKVDSGSIAKPHMYIFWSSGG